MASALRVLGIDPGLTRCGVGAVDVTRDRSASLVHVGVVRSATDLPIEQRLATIAAGGQAKYLEGFGPKVEGFDQVPFGDLTAAEDAIGPETAAILIEPTAPVRILRDESGQCSVRGLYPCGEGAGYAGGILSAAADGMRCAEKIWEVYNR